MTSGQFSMDLFNRNEASGQFSQNLVEISSVLQQQNKKPNRILARGRVPKWNLPNFKMWNVIKILGCRVLPLHALELSIRRTDGGIADDPSVSES